MIAGPSARPSGLLLAILICCWLDLSCSLTLAVDTNVPSDLPSSSLRPPRPEIPPSFWEQHGLSVIGGATLLLILLGLGVWWLTRPKPAPVVPCSVHARQELESLRTVADQELRLNRSSQILRRCFAEMFDLASGELTTSEFRRAVSGNTRVGPRLAQASTEFLQACDFHKFAPAHPEAPADPVNQATLLIRQAEERLAELARAESPDAAQPCSSSGRAEISAQQPAAAPARQSPPPL